MLLHLRSLGQQKTPCEVPILQKLLDKMNLGVPNRDKSSSSAIPYSNDGIVDFDTLEQSEASSSYPSNLMFLKRLPNYKFLVLTMASAVQVPQLDGCYPLMVFNVNVFINVGKF